MQALVLLAHADDETLGCGGTILKLAQRGWEVRIVIVSNGLLDVRGKVEDNRPGAAAACDILGVGAPIFLGFRDQRFEEAAIADIANAVADLGLQPDVIFTHVDTDLNFDHRIVCDVAKIVGRPKTRPISILACEIPSTSFWNGLPFPANYYVDITNELDTKIEAFANYKNELQDYPHPWSREGLRLLAQYHGMQCGFQYAEGFRLIRGYEQRLP